ncbi:oocyte zinc finger protein XlCOF7.1-like [Mya arenaria]|uniref:oocyte zinc finger protein XlCOF7.1-like n=1 Tax=Mya arenaria TaxID=6604 RepID=UPI0022E6F9A2|nr:oocyte zinc finger protein XlCOF7.1-like [Mya arenaria]
MEKYFLTLLVTLEQETAIRDLFSNHKWELIFSDAEKCWQRLQGWEENSQSYPAAPVGVTSPGELASVAENEEKVYHTLEQAYLGSGTSPEQTNVAEDDCNSGEISAVKTMTPLQIDTCLSTLEHNTENYDKKTPNYNMDTDTDVNDDMSDQSFKRAASKIRLKTFKFSKNGKKAGVKLKKIKNSRKLKRENGMKYSCLDCSRNFTSKGHLATHKAINNGLCYFRCQYCEKIFYRKYNYQCHVRTHTHERPYICEHCGRGYVTAHKLNLHKRVHTGYKPCVCEQCGRAFHNLSALAKHREYHHTWKEQNLKFTCDICNTNFSSDAYLKYHKKVTHCLTREFQCSECEKFFKAEEHLKYHIKFTHAVKAVFRCNFCDKTFKSPSSLRKHVERHNTTREKKFQCTHCDKCFYEKYKLEQHENIHLGRKPFQCDMCEYSCAFSGNLSKHKKIHLKSNP